MDEPTRPMRRTIGPYTCLKLIGMSSNSTVYLAQREGDERLMALRLLPITSSDPAQTLAECAEQLDFFMQFHDDYVVPIVDYGTFDEALYIAMPYMQGGSLSERLKARAETADPNDTQTALPSLGETAQLLEQVGAALDSIHQRDMVHGQVEPRNIMLADDGSAHLADAGLTRLLKIMYGLDSTNSFSMNQFSAPELWDGADLTSATDLYSLACVAYRLVAGKPPFDATSIYGLMQQHTNADVMPPHYVRQGVPSDLAIPFWRALAKRPEQRYRSVAEFADDFRHAVRDREGEPTDFFTFALPES